MGSRQTPTSSKGGRAVGELTSLRTPLEAAAYRRWPPSPKNRMCYHNSQSELER